MVTHSELLTQPESIQALVARLQTEKAIAFDTEFIRENTFYPVVEILQIASETESWLVDVKSIQKSPNSQEVVEPLLKLFKDPGILKIVHAAQGDQECLWTSFGITAEPVLDTSVAASLCGYGDGIGLGNLLKAALGVQIKKGHARTNWSVRPLPDQLIEYAHADVVHLVELGQKLLSELEASGRKEWALELSARSADSTLYDPDPESIARKLVKSGKLDKKGYAALVELVRWREARVKFLNLPRRWVADDQVLLDLAHVRPKDLAHLSAFRGLNKGEVKNSGQAILEAIKKAEAAQDIKLPRLPKPVIPSSSESQVLDLLRCYIGILSDRHQISARHIAVSAQLLPLLRSQAASPKDWVTEGLLSEGAAELVGEEIFAFLRGERALSVEGSRIRIVEVPKG